jgi:protein required for attachment to host cells
MILPHNSLVLVTDGRKMLLLRNGGLDGKIQLRTESHDFRDDDKNRDIRSDAPGLSGQSAGFGRPALDEPDYHQLDENIWAAKTAEILNVRALENDFEKLVVIAPPRTMGELRQHWHKATLSRIVAEITKEMTDRPITEIESLLAGEGAPPSGGGSN